MDWLNVSYDGTSRGRKTPGILDQQTLDQRIQEKFLQIKKKFYEEYLASKSPYATKPKPIRSCLQGDGTTFLTLAGRVDNLLLEPQPNKKRTVVTSSLNKRDISPKSPKLDPKFERKRIRQISPYEISPRMKTEGNRGGRKIQKENLLLPSLPAAKKKAANPKSKRKQILYHSIDCGPPSKEYRASPYHPQQRKDQLQKPNQRYQLQECSESYRTLTTNNSTLETVNPEEPVHCELNVKKHDPKLRQVVERNLERASLDISKIKRNFREGGKTKYLFVVDDT